MVWFRLGSRLRLRLSFYGLYIGLARTRLAIAKMARISLLAKQLYAAQIPDSHRSHIYLLHDQLVAIREKI